MKVDVKIPEVGESITEATIGEWMKKSGEHVNRDDVLLSLETDKASVEVVAEQAGKLEISVEAGETVAIGAVVGTIDTEAQGEANAKEQSANAQSKPQASAEPAPAPEPENSNTEKTGGTGNKETLSPAAKAHADQKGVDISTIQGSGKDGRIMKPDVLQASQSAAKPTQTKPNAESSSANVSSANYSIVPEGEREKRVPMSSIRKRIAQRLVEAQQTAAILTTFNEVDMTEVFAIRAKYKETFKEKHGIGLGFMGFFTKACAEALKEIPAVNASIDGEDIIYKNFYNIGIAVSSDKGLMVPVIKDADLLSIAGLEREIRAYAQKARDGKISISDLSGGTFTITNGGVFGSLNSTPILTPPQVGILGMHKVQERPVAIDGKVEIRPMMYLALSYDHRIIDGKEAVTFLVKVKEMIEDPSRMLIEV